MTQKGRNRHRYRSRCPPEHPDIVLEPPVATPISRRRLLRAAGTTSLAVLLAACSNSADGEAPTSRRRRHGDEPPTARTPATPPPTRTSATRRWRRSASTPSPRSRPIVATFEVLTGPTGRIPFGVLDAEQQPLLDRDVQLWVVQRGRGRHRADRAAVLRRGPRPARRLRRRGRAGPRRGCTTRSCRSTARPVGVAAFSARTPEKSTSYPPGTEFPVIATPTEDDPGALETLCTREPPCSMHADLAGHRAGHRPRRVHRRHARASARPPSAARSWTCWRSSRAEVERATSPSSTPRSTTTPGSRRARSSRTSACRPSPGRG